MKMEALVLTAPRKLVHRPEPAPRPEQGEVLVSVEFAGICGSELGGFLGTNTLRTPPVIMGHEAAGRIAAPGGGRLADGSRAEIGQTVTFNPLLTCGSCPYCRSNQSNLCRQRRLVGAHRPGAFARWVAVPAGQCWPLAETTGLLTASLAEPLACAARCCRQTGLDRGQRLVILGVGPIGLLCLKVALHLGIEEVAVVDRMVDRLELSRKWGATAGLRSDTPDLSGTLQQVLEGPPDVVIDAVGAHSSRSTALAAVRPGGTIGLIGLHEETSPVHANRLVRDEIRVVGSFAYTQEDFGRAIDLLERGLVEATPDWVAVRPLAEGQACFEELVDGSSGTAKIVLRPEGYQSPTPPSG